MATQKQQIEKLQADVKLLQEEMFRQKFWLRPPEPEPIIPDAYATDCDYFNEVATNFVHIQYSWRCPTCKEMHKQQTLRMPGHTQNPFVQFKDCTLGHRTRIIFQK